MTFSEDVRRELVGRQPSRACCRDALLSGLIRGAGSIQVRGHGELAVVLELADPAAARLAFSIVRRRGADAEIVSFRERRLHRRNLVRLRLAGDRSLQLLHEEAGGFTFQATWIGETPEARERVALRDVLNDVRENRVKNKFVYVVGKARLP